MKRTIAIATMLALACVALHAAGAETVQLTYTESGVRGLPTVETARRYAQALPGPPAGFEELPEGLSDDIYSGKIGAADNPTVVLADLGDAPRLYLDMDGDGLLTDEAPLEPVDAKGTGASKGVEVIVFGTVRLPGGPAIHLEVHKYGDVARYLVCEPAGVQAGRVTLGGREFALHLVDANLDGRYDVGMKAGASGRDVIAMDVNGDGEFTTGSLLEPEVFALKRLLRVAGSYLEVAPAADGSSVELRPYAGPMGILDVGDPDGGTVLIARDATFALSGDGGRWEVPAGAYKVGSVFLSGKDEDGATWMLASSEAPPGARTLDVEENTTTNLAMGQPLVLRTSATKTGRRQMGIGLTLAGDGQESYTPGGVKDGETMPPPSFRLVDRDGNILAAGTFEYG